MKSYLIFARKWRPQNFDEIIGQEEVVRRLKNALQANRLGQAFLFSGPHGVGKTSAARILAKSLNCQSGPTLNPCGKCPSCLEITEGRSMDVIEIDGASNRGIDEIRSLREGVKFSPVNSKFKVYIIDEVHQITSDGFNALLKTLEEPPDFVKFIFATTHAHKVIPTILSRCQRFNFRRIGVLKIIEQLKKIALDEKIKIEDDVFLAIAKAAEGSLRDAESMLDEMITFKKDKISLKDIVSVLGIVEHEVLLELTDNIIAKNALGALKLLDEVIREGKDTSSFINNIIEHFRNLMILKLTHSYDSELIDLPEEACKRLIEQSNKLSMQEIFSVFNVLMGAQEASKKLVTFKIPIEIALVRLCAVKSQENNNLDKPKVKINPKEDNVKKNKEEPKIVKSEKEQIIKENSALNDASIEQARKIIEIDAIKELWPNILEKVSQVKLYIMHCLENTVPLKMNNNVLTLGCLKQFNFYKDALESRDNRSLVEKVISDVSGESIRLNLEYIPESFELPKELKPAERDQNINSALEMFKGKLIE